MNRHSVVLCLMAMLFSVATTIAGDDPLLKGTSNTSGTDALPTKRIKLQEYSNDIPRYGNYYEWDGSKWQRYKDAIPLLGSYLKEVKPEERSPEMRDEKQNYTINPE